MNIWNYILKTIRDNKKLILLYVLDSKGSSPGRKDFALAIREDGGFMGTIGGGIMEHKLVELAKELLIKNENKILIKKQYHNKENKNNQSGMICSGEQTIAFIPMDFSCNVQMNQLENALENNIPFSFRINSERFSISLILPEKEDSFLFENENNWEFNSTINKKEKIHIFGAGHVGLALSQILSLMDFYIAIYDDRASLNTFESNSFADEKQIIDYNNVLEQIKINKNDYIVLVTFSYRSDKLLLEQLYKEKYKYIGMMGSEGKIKNLYEELKKQGIREEELSHVYAPIGMPIYSKTTQEIAVSIAGEIIKIKNKDLPNGRSY